MVNWLGWLNWWSAPTYVHERSREPILVGRGTVTSFSIQDGPATIYNILLHLGLEVDSLAPSMLRKKQNTRNPSLGVLQALPHP